MKRIHVIGIVVIAISVGVIISTISDSSTYTTFAEAAENPGMQYQVVGVPDTNKALEYDPASSPYFSFHMTDRDGNGKRVKFRGSKPQDFELSDQVVVTVSFDGSEFIASKILMKCPSKYNNGNEVEVKATES